MAIRAAVFDLDGTLCDTISDIGASFNRSFAAVGLPTRPVREYGAFVGFGIRENLRRAAPPGADPAVLEEALRRYLEDYPVHCADSTVPYPGIRALLEALTERQIRVSVVTNKTEATAQKLLTAILPEIPFAFVWGRREGRALKPSRELGEAAAAELALPPEEILYCGDAEPDVAFARNAGFRCVAAAWGYRSREALEAAGAERIAACPEEILTYLD